MIGVKSYQGSRRRTCGWITSFLRNHTETAHVETLFSFERSTQWICSSAGLERTPDKREVDGSSPFRSIQWGLSSVGRAPALHAGGQEFESPRLHW